MLLMLQVPWYAGAEPGQGGGADEASGASAGQPGETPEQGTPTPEEPDATESEPVEEPSDGTEATTDDENPAPVDGEEPIAEDAVIDKETTEEDSEGLLMEPFATTDFDGALVTITSAVNTNRYLDISERSVAPSVAVVLSSQSYTPSQRFKLARDGSGYYSIVNVNSNQVLDIMGASPKNGTKVIQYPANNGNNQKWQITEHPDGSYSFVSKLNSDIYLDLSDSQAGNGSNLIIHQRDPKRTSQHFSINKIVPAISNGVYTIQSVASNKALDIQGASFANSSPAIVYSANKGFNQRFIFTYNQQTGYYTITSVNSNRVLDVAGASRNDGAAIVQYSSNKGFNQQWNIVYDQSSKNYFFFVANSGKCLDIKNGSTANSAPVITWSYHGGNNQRWKINSTVLLDEGLDNVLSVSGLYMDVRSSSEANNADILLYSATKGLNQKFFIKKAGNAFNVYTIECARSGKLLSTGATTGNLVYQYADRGKGSGDSYQQWIVEPVGNASFRFKNVGTGKYLDYGKGALSTALQVSEKGNVASQSWKFSLTDPLPDGLYVLASALNNNLVLEIPSFSVKPETSLSLWTANGGANQTFKIAKLGSGRYSIINLNSGLALDVKNGAINATTGAGSVIQWAYSGGNNQVWVIEYAGSGNFRFVSALQNGRATITLGSTSPADGTAVGLLNTNEAATQAFKPKAVGSISYYQMNCTLNEFIGWQTTNPVTALTLKPIIDPTASNKGGYAFLQFADVRVGTGLTGAQLNAFIDSTDKGRSGIFHNRGQAFADAAKQYGLNEVYFLSHAILESDWGTSGFAMGNYYDGIRKIGGKTYPAGTYYNFWGIGAYDSNPNYAIDYAVMHGWSSPEKAIYGSAQWIALNYIYGDYPQPTVYAMRWDYMQANATNGAKKHQYATSLTWQDSIPKLMNQCYNKAGVTPTLYYVIPKFK